MKISHLKRYSKDGTVYRNTVIMLRIQFELLQDAVNAEIEMNYINNLHYSSEGYHHAKRYLKPLKLINSVCYLNITQSKYIKRYTDMCTKKPLNIWYNTCILVEDL